MKQGRTKTPPTTTERVRKHRQALRAQGYKPVQVWVPDVHSPAFQKRVRKAAQILKKDLGSPAGREIFDHIAMTTARWIKDEPED